MGVTAVSHSAPVELVLSRITPPAKANGARSWMARCPAHEDRTPSLSITEGKDGRALLKCHAGCTTQAIVGALGLTMGDLFPPSVNGAPRLERDPAPPTRHVAMIKSYDYTDEQGDLLYQVCRFVDQTTGKKDFRQRRPLPGGDWSWKLGDARLVPYRLPQILEAIAAERTVYVVEGEKDVETLEALGYTATTNSGGAGKWRDEFSAAFRGARVGIIPDNDEPGTAHAEQVAASLAAAGAIVRIVALPELPAKGDVTDWLQTHSREDLEAAIVRARPWTGPTLAPSGLPYAVRALDAPPPEPITWCVEELLVTGELAVFAGDGGSFKSTAGFHIAAAVAGGYSVFNRFPTRQAPALILSAEDGAGVILNRLDALCTGQGWDRDRVLSNVHIIASHDAKLSSVAWQAHLLDECARLGVGFVLCDPLFDLVDGDENSNSDLRPVIKFCRKLATTNNAAVAIVHHAAKVKADQRAIDRVRGASAIRDASRCLLFFEWRPEGISVEHLKMSRSEKLPAFVLTREIESSPESRAIWCSARLSCQSPKAAAMSHADSVVLDLIIADPGKYNSGDLRHAASKHGVNGEGTAAAVSDLQARGLICWVPGPKRQRLWSLPGLASQPAQTERAGQADSENDLPNLPGVAEAGHNVPPARPSILPPLKGGRQDASASRAGQGGQDRAANDTGELDL